MRILVLAGLAASLAACGTHHGANPYAGQESRAIKALSEREVQALLEAEVTRAVALLQAELRTEHLNTHLAQTALLQPTQVQRYQQLRGDAGAAR